MAVAAGLVALEVEEVVVASFGSTHCPSWMMKKMMRKKKSRIH